MMATATTTPTAWITVKDASARLGITPALLRLWESRYGWPSPRRAPNGQRRLNPADLAEIERVLAHVRAGRPIGSLIVDGRPVLPEAPRARREPLGEAALAGCPLPARTSARMLRDELVAALRRRDTAGALATLARAPRDCTPEDRPWAAWAPILALLAAHAVEGIALAGADRLRAAVAQQAAEALARRPATHPLPVGGDDADAVLTVAAALTLAGHAAAPAATGEEPVVVVGGAAAPGDRGRVDPAVPATLAELCARAPGWAEAGAVA